MKNHRTALLAALVLLAPASLLAVPAWSRSEATNCSSCHATPTWQLTNVGLDFLKNGHRNEPLKYNQKAMTWDNYFSFLWKYRGYTDRLAGEIVPDIVHVGIESTLGRGTTITLRFPAAATPGA